jgi:predicted ATPase
MIVRLEALNYKSLRYVSQSISPFQVVIGPNASGKSTFLDVIAFMGDLLYEGPEFAVAERASRSTRINELTWKGKGTRIELAIEMRIPENVRSEGSQHKVCRYEVAIGSDDENPRARVLAEALLLLPESNGSKQGQRALFPLEPTVPDTILSRSQKSKPRSKTVVKKIEDSGNDYFKSETTDWNTLFRFGPSKTALANLPEDPHKFPVATWAKRFLMSGIQSLMLNSAAMRPPATRDSGFALSLDGANLASVVRRLQRQQPKRFDSWLAHVKTALPDIEDIRVRESPQDRSVYLTLVYSQGLRVPSWLVSDGTLRFLALTILAYLQPTDSVYLIEEPENGIHPQAVESVFQSLSSTYDSQVLLATHSPILLRLAKPEQILCFGKTPEGSTDIVIGSEHPRLKNWQGEVTLADLFAAGVLG